MGRGRAKAKQTKVARELKYNSPNMDLDRLKADLGAGSAREDTADDSYSDDSYEYEYGYADEDDDNGRR